MEIIKIDPEIIKIIEAELVRIDDRIKYLEKQRENIISSIISLKYYVPVKKSE